MKRTRVVGFVIFLVFLLLASGGKGEETEAIFRHKCQVASRRFKGICMSDQNCISVCKSEGHDWGGCEGARRRCLCNVPCKH